ncbi:Uncharacterized protein TCAP_03045 [Tolypocladium capitatum]|uniref:Uncharacterized protein n=1 Tax=Tolypocladium capitatum TaxID=45235 RepID=A0A2K3QHJ7_9HYPO|nr:Uncharacterized protein TCAP_03045 [Tolypocladium capitatum]
MVTAAPQFQTIVESIYQTLTKTVSGGGRDNIEITINTGDSTRRKKHSVPRASRPLTTRWW